MIVLPNLAPWRAPWTVTGKATPGGPFAPPSPPAAPPAANAAPGLADEALAGIAGGAVVLVLAAVGMYVKVGPGCSSGNSKAAA